ncbi:MAG: right-handed parallel beta-helix repeat-containing protein [Blautia sp.]|nr:right-handed parallel beta-helix repeat-containing protein [Blautia sp.]
MKLYVNVMAPKGGDGSVDAPFSCLQDAANIAQAGDEVIVAPGVYREWVDPRQGGTAENRITYRSEKPLEAILTGAEPLTGWEPLGDNVWKTSVPNALFGDYNPYTTKVEGDWFIASYTAHTGEIFLGDKALYEVLDLEEVKHPVRIERSWGPDFTIYTWYTKPDEARDETLFYANFQGLNPNEEKVEFTVRRNCFLPSAEGIGYITLSGFTVTKAATQWAPPTAYQDGMIGPHWSKGWIIEDCDISHSKCSGISLGKYLQPENDNKWLKWKYKDGTQTERECIMQAQREGWSKETVGSHIVRRCNIHDCGQTGIVGHLGGVFSLIEDNHIHHINNRQNLAGAEIGGIKMHAAIDCIYRRNHIHHCTRGIWLDWQAQGTRVTQNLFHDNTLPFDHLMREDCLEALGEDIFVEVSHGPTLIDHNLLLSTRSCKLPAQGIALVHNLIAGSFTCVGTGVANGTSKGIPSPRYTPYHVPHGTAVAGFMTILHGDMRFYNNIFLQQRVPAFLEQVQREIGFGNWDDYNVTVGSCPYTDYQTVEEWEKEFEGYCGMGSGADRYYIPLPVSSGGNVFFNGAKPMEKEKDYFVEEREATLELIEKEGKWYLSTNLDQLLPSGVSVPVNTEVLGMAFEPEQAFEAPDGSALLFEEGYFGEKVEERIAGPFATREGFKKPLW